MVWAWVVDNAARRIIKIEIVGMNGDGGKMVGRVVDVFDVFAFNKILDGIDGDVKENIQY